MRDLPATGFSAPRAVKLTCADPLDFVPDLLKRWSFPGDPLLLSAIRHRRPPQVSFVRAPDGTPVHPKQQPPSQCERCPSVPLLESKRVPLPHAEASLYMWCCSINGR